MPRLKTEKPYGFRTICEVHREIYRDLKARNPNDPLLVKVEEAFNMAKKMNNKLRQYKHRYDDGWWEKNRLAGGEVEEEK